jgi:hypothetical protein
MKRLISLVVVCLLVAGSAYLGFNATAAETEKAKETKSESKGEQVTITGQFSCTFCKIAHPDKVCSADCCKACTKAGDPAILTDAEGNMYLLLTDKMGEKMLTPERAGMLGGQVTVKGLLVKGKGLQAIYVDSMQKVEAKVESKESKEKK